MNVINVSLNKIKLGKNSRMNIDKTDLTGLMESIKYEGLLEPIGISKQGKSYQIAYGNRRFLAYSKLGKRTIPAVVLENKNQGDIDLMNLAENIQRSNITVVEAGRYMDTLMKSGLTKEEIRIRLGVSTNYISCALSTYLTVPKEFQNNVAVSNGPGVAKNQKNKITASYIPKIVGACRGLNLNQTQTKQMFKLAMKKGYVDKEAYSYGQAIKAGAKDPMKAVGSIKTISFSMLVTEKEYDRIYTKHVLNGPFKTISQVVRAIVGGKIADRVAIKN